MSKLIWKTVKVKVRDLKKAEFNPRRITEQSKKHLLESLNKFDLVDIPVVNKDWNVISGNQRIDALIISGRSDEEIDVRIPNRQLSEKEEKEYMLIANTHAGVFDVELLEAHFEDVNIEFEIPMEFEEQQKESKNINLLNETNLDSEIDKFKSGIRKAIQIEFEPADYDEAVQLVKFCRDKDLYIGKFLIDKLKQEKNNHEHN